MRPRVIQTAASALGLGVAGLLWASHAPAPALPPIVRVIPIQPLAVLQHASSPAVAISPDGRYVAYVSGESARGQLYVRPLEAAVATPVPGAQNAHGPFFSPDGQWLGFLSGAELKKVSVHGGDSVTVCSKCADVHGASWGSDDTIFLGAADGVSRISATGGTPEVVARPAGLWPEMIPGHDTLLYTQAGWIWAHALQSGERRRLIESDGNARYAVGHLIYPSGGSLKAVPLDIETLRLGSSAPLSIVRDIMMGLPEEPTIGHFAVSSTGTLIYLAGSQLASPGNSLHWVDRYAREQDLDVEPRRYARPRISPDGTRVAVGYSEADNFDIGVYDLVRKTFSRLTSSPAADDHPLWTPDGRRIIFRSTRGGGRNLFSIRADGGGEEPLTNDPQLDADPFAFTPDGKQLAYTRPNKTAGYDVHLLTMTPPYISSPLIEEASSRGSPTISPDGRWIAYRSAETTDRSQIVVRPFPNVAGGRWQITTDNAGPPVWSPAGGEIFYTYGALGTMMSVPVRTGSVITSGKSQSVFTGSYTFAGDSRNFDVTPDGKRFLIIKEVTARLQPSNRDELTVVVNWARRIRDLGLVMRD